MIAVTDPDGNAWLNLLNQTYFLDEVGSECTFADAVLQNPATGNFEDAFFFVDIFQIGSHQYGVLPAYNNARHACTIQP